ncbi:MAG: ATP-binding protein [Gammaproteobacteria bacterium]
MAEQSLRILLIDERDKDRELATFILERELTGVQVLPVANAMDFVEAITGDDINAVVTECQLSWSDGAQIFKALQRLFPAVPVIYFSDASNPDGAMKSRNDMRDTLLKKDSGGFLALPHVVKRLLQTNGIYAETSATSSARSSTPVTNPKSGSQVIQAQTLFKEPAAVADYAMGSSAVAVAEPEPKSQPVAAPMRGLIERLPVGVVGLTADGSITHANVAFATLLGACDTHDVIGKHLPALLGDEESRRLVQETLERSGDLGLILNFRGISTGKEVWVRLDVWPVRDERGQVQHFEGAVVDITADRRREQDIVRQNAELGRSNAQLEQFALMTAHDLQAPMGLISRYTRLLRDRYANSLDGDGKRYIEQLLDNTHQLHDLIGGILAYAKVGSQDLQAEPVDFAVAVHQAVENLQVQFESMGAELQYDSLPTVTIDKNQLVRLLQNLFSNALKFRSQDKPVIKLRADRQGEYWQFTVQDNGVGIPLDEQSRIFGMFQRAHTKDSPGNGMGLAICQGIVERHGGELWVESTPGAGSTFYFTLPV